jgi:hypothetical protein
MPARARLNPASQNAARSAQRGLGPRAVAAVIVRALTEPRPRPLVGRDALAASVVAALPFRLRNRLAAARA